jgi:hypothetical protein
LWRHSATPAKTMYRRIIWLLRSSFRKTADAGQWFRRLPGHITATFGRPESSDRGLNRGAMGSKRFAATYERSPSASHQATFLTDCRSARTPH